MQKKETCNRRDFIKKTSKLAALAGISGSGLLLKGCTSRQDYDLVILGGRVYDGLGQKGEGTQLDIGIKDGLIAALEKINSSRGRFIIDAQGLVVCPGFIDVHDHTDIGLLVNPKAESHIRQGITTLVSGNCGGSPFPIGDEIFEEARTDMIEQYDVELTWRDLKGFFSRLSEVGMAVNYATFVGHGSIRGAAMGFHDRPPKPDELEKMKALVTESIGAGALGLSTGLVYPPGCYAQPDEITALCRTVAFYNGIHATHMRDEGDLLLESMDETIEVARQTGIKLQISHFKIAYPRNWDKIDAALLKLETAVKDGIDLYCDRYPYTAGSTGLASFNFPQWALQGTTTEILTKFKDPTLESKLRAHIKQREEQVGSWDKVVVSSVFSEKNKKFEGRSILDCSQLTGKDAFEFMRDLLIEEKGRVGQIIFSMKEDNLKKILAHPLVGIGCDGAAIAPYGKLSQGKPHPRHYGTFPRVLGKYIREEKLIPLAEMIRKMTSRPAERLGFKQRGSLQKGFHADIVIFDEATVADKATWQQPHQYPQGIKYVIVNGQPVIQQGEHTGSLPGQILAKT